MEKPYGLKMKEFEDNIVNVINESGIHPACIELIMDRIMKELHTLSINTLNKEKEEYEKSLASEQTIETEQMEERVE